LQAALRLSFPEIRSFKSRGPITGLFNFVTLLFLRGECYLWRGLLSQQPSVAGTFVRTPATVFSPRVIPHVLNENGLGSALKNSAGRWRLGISQVLCFLENYDAGGVFLKQSLIQSKLYLFLPCMWFVKELWGGFGRLAGLGRLSGRQGALATDYARRGFSRINLVSSCDLRHL
jgi:hypothetical protein